MNESKNENKYKSFSLSVFTLTRIYFLGILPLFVVMTLALEDRTGGTAFLQASCIMLFISALYAVTSFTTVSIQGNNIKLKSLTKQINVSNLNSYRTWWSYDFGVPSAEVGDWNTGQSKPTANKINVFLKLESANEVAYIYEQIYLSTKFPNNHAYSPNEVVDKSKMIRVWDIDNCIEKLNIKKITK